MQVHFIMVIINFSLIMLMYTLFSLTRSSPVISFPSFGRFVEKMFCLLTAFLGENFKGITRHDKVMKILIRVFSLFENT